MAVEKETKSCRFCKGRGGGIVMDDFIIRWVGCGECKETGRVPKDKKEK